MIVVNTSAFQSSRIFLGLLALGTFWLSFNGLHYWHEVRFSFAVSNFALSDVLTGAFNPHQLGHAIDETSAAGFYLAKAFHLAWLDVLFTWRPLQDGGFEDATLISLILMGATTFFVFNLFRHLLGSAWLANLAVVCFLAAPITPYLAGKLLSEVPAIFFTSVCFVVFLNALQHTGMKSALWLGVSILTALLATLSRLDILLSLLGFWIAVIVVQPDGIEGGRPRCITLIIMVLIVWAVAYVLILNGSHARFPMFVHYFRDFTQAGMKSVLLSLLGFVTFGGLVYVACLSAIKSDKKKWRRFFAVWLLCSALPMALITWCYMIEPRYLVSGLIPLAGLGALGGEALFKTGKSCKAKKVVAGAALAAVLIVNYVSVRIMPYELDEPKLIEAVHLLQRQSPSAAILLPWAYTDFHFLKSMFPESRIYNVHGELNADGSNPLAIEWQARLRSWYGDSYLDSPERLRALMEERAVYYVGWRTYMPLENLIRWTKAAGLATLSAKLNALPMQDHLTSSWVWRWPHYWLEWIEHSGPYELYQLKGQQEANQARKLFPSQRNFTHEPL